MTTPSSMICPECGHSYDSHSITGCEYVIREGAEEVELCTCKKPVLQIVVDAYNVLRRENARLVDLVYHRTKECEALRQNLYSELDAWSQVRDVTEDRDAARAECEQLRSALAKVTGEYQDAMMRWDAQRERVV